MLDPKPLEPLTARTALTRALRLYGQHFGTLVAISFVALVPGAAFQAVTIRRIAELGAREELSNQELLVTGLVFYPVAALLGLAGYSLISGAITFAVGHSYLGRRFGLMEALGYAAGRLGALMSINISIGLRVFLGYLLLIIPGIVWICAYSLAVPALITEGLRPRQALKRSADLARGRRWTIFGVLLTVLVWSSILGSLLLLYASASELELEAPAGVTAYQFVISLLTALLVPILLIAMTLLYYDARTHTEGFDLDILRQEFSANSPSRRPNPRRDHPAAAPSAQRTAPTQQTAPDRALRTKTGNVAPPAQAPTPGRPGVSTPTNPSTTAAGKLAASDLFVELDEETKASLLDDWRWLVGQNARVFHVTVFGDIFVTTSAAQVYKLDTGRGTYEKVAENFGEWNRRLPASTPEWFHIELVRDLHAMHLRLAKGQVYSWLEPPMAGGQETVENVYAISVVSHVRQMAEIAKSSS